MQISPQRGGQRVADQFGGRLVERDDALLGVDREHSFDHTGKHGLLLVGLTHDGLQTLLQLRRHLVQRAGEPGHFFRISRGQLVGEIAAGNRSATSRISSKGRLT